MRGLHTPRSGWYKNKKLLSLLGVMALLVLFFITMRLLGSAANGSVDNSANFEAGQTERPPAPVKVAGHYISFAYPDSFRSTPSQKPDAIQLENFNYVTKKSPYWQLAISVRTLPSNNVSDDGSYSMRVKNPSQYKPESWMVDDQKIAVFSDGSQSYSKVAFWLHSGHLATIALSGNGAVADIQGVQQGVLNSLEWK